MKLQNPKNDQRIFPEIALKNCEISLFAMESQFKGFMLVFAFSLIELYVVNDFMVFINRPGQGTKLK